MYFEQSPREKMVDKVEKEMEETENEYNDSDNSEHSKSFETPAVNISIVEEVKEKPIIKKSKRIFWIDALRVFANFLVILTHVGLRFDRSKFGSLNWYIMSFYNSVSRPCVPLFVMISGLLFLNPKKEVTCSKMYSKYIYRIFKAYVFWTIFYNIFEDNLYLYFGEDNYKFDDKAINKIIRRTIASNHNHLWYLNFVIGLYMVTPIIKKITTDKHISWYACIIFCIVTQFIPTIHNTFTKLFEIKEVGIIQEYTNGLKMEIAGSYVTYYILGYLLNEDNQNKKHLNVILSILFTIVGSALTYGLKIALSLHTNNNDLVFLDFSCFGVSMASIGIFLLFKYLLKPIIDSMINIKILEKSLILLSDCSFGIYLVHIAIQRIIDQFLPVNMFSPFFWPIVQTLLIYFVSFVIIYIVRMVPLLRDFV